MINQSRRRYRERRQSQEPSLTLALICGVLGLFCLLPFSIMALALAAPHRNHVRDAGAAWALGWVGVVIAVVAGAFLVAHTYYVPY